MSGAVFVLHLDYEAHRCSVLRGMGGDYKKLSDDILGDPEAREAVWGKEHFIKSRQNEAEAETPDDLQP